MEYFNINAYWIGVLFTGCILINNIIFSLICIIWDIKILEFTLFGNAWFALHKERVMGTDFILGWIPFGGSVKPLGKNADEEELSKINPVDLPKAFFNKPKYLQSLFQLAPWLIYLIATMIAVFISTQTSFQSELTSICSYISDAFETMFSDNVKDRAIFIESTKQIIEGKSIIVFGFTLLVILMLLIAPFVLIANWLTDDDKSKFQKTIGFTISICYFWLFFWKMPKFIFSFFTIWQSMVYFSSFLIGMFSMGLVLFYTILFIVKNLSQNISSGKEL